MGSRLAFVAVIDDFEGMFLAKGDERSVRVSGLGEGEHIRLEVISYEDLTPLIITRSGVFPLILVRGHKFKIQKVRDSDTRNPTTVEILTNGSSSG